MTDPRFTDPRLSDPVIRRDEWTSGRDERRRHVELGCRCLAAAADRLPDHCWLE